MTHGRQVCNTLKQIRRQIADKNEIEYTTSECHFEGECEGTCPKCESEVKYLENELYRRTQLGKAVAVAGISLGMVGTFSACNTPKQTNTPISEQEQEIIIPKTTDTIIPLIIPSKKCKNTQNLTVKDTTIILDTLVVKGLRPIIEMGEVAITQGQIAAYYIDYPGGYEALIKFIKENLKYPKKAKKRGIEGTVVVDFWVETDGSLTNLSVEKSIPFLDKEALRVVKSMPKWKIIEHDGGKPVRMQYQIPVEFKMD